MEKVQVYQCPRTKNPEIMAWVTSNNTVHNPFSSLYVQHGDIFTVNDDCLAILEEILRNLVQEDCNLRNFRRSVGFEQNIRKNLIPLLVYVKNDSNILNAADIINTTIKILVNLTIPMEYLLPVDVMSRTEVGKHTIHELNKLLTTSKEVFTDSWAIKTIVDHMKYIVESNSLMDVEQCDSINNCLLLLRNILHIPENKTPLSNGSLTHSSMQNQIIWNLFTQSIDKILIYLMSCSQKMYWAVTLVQLIALMYKDQHVGTLQKLLNLWLESSYSESSDDNESNTSPPPDQRSDDSSPIITSDPTSDSSDNDRNNRNNSNANKAINNSERVKSNTIEIMRSTHARTKGLVNMKRNKSIETESSSAISSMGQSTESNDSHSAHANMSQSSTGKKSGSMCPSSQSEISDCGYGTQVENQESISTSSNDDDQPHQKPVHQKPHTFQKTRYSNVKCRATTALEKKELRRKKLVKRSKTNIINVKGLVHHLPTDEDISNILKEFTVDFLLKGYGTLVHDLHSQLLANVHIPIDTSHFFWLVTYFLKFAAQLELDLEHIHTVLCYSVLSYLVFQGVSINEELKITCGIPNIDLKPCLRRLHLVVTAIREFLQGLETYQKMIHLSNNDRDNLSKLQGQIGQMEDLKMLFILLLRQYNPSIQSRQYLQDLILTNHNLLLFLDNNSRVQDRNFNMIEHLKEFASVEIMKQYGLLLENFKQNGEFVNNCIFTMMHHMGGDLKNVSTLFQPSILKTFSQIWETDYEICDDWSDLIEYVIHKFIHTPGRHYADAPIEHHEENLVDIDDLSTSEKGQSEWTREEKDNLLKYYNQSKESSDAIAKITEKYEESGMRCKTPFSIIRELLDQSIITESEYDDLMRDNKLGRSDSLPNEETFQPSHEENYVRAVEHLDSDIKVLKEYLNKENKGKFLVWLQNLLMEACYVKLVLNSPDEFKNDYIMEPTIYYYALVALKSSASDNMQVLDLPIPVIPWTVEQTNILKHQPFVLLLHKLGFFLPSDTGKVFYRIPNFWTAENIFGIAQQLGPIDPEKLKFDINKVQGRNKCDSSKTRTYSNDSFYESGKFSTLDLKQTPSIVRYTPLPNSSEWFQNILRPNGIPVADVTLPSTGQLSITIPEADLASCDSSPPELTIAPSPGGRGLGTPSEGCPDHMECSLFVHDPDLVLMDELERASNCDTASVASDLTRMCVSDEEEKVTVAKEKNVSL